MFITDSRGNFTFAEVKNGKIVDRKPLDEREAKKVIKDNNLVKQGSIFNNCFTYRDYESTKLINELLRT